jgi:hypothetical protein
MTGHQDPDFGTLPVAALGLLKNIAVEAVSSAAVLFRPVHCLDE